ncbi:2-oxoglutarate and iron-dependent oxygenase domain-containing protein [Streptomyces sp. NPDC048669]|uniref:2-oxoglutarate and iron-dependent oxygenase domain-containing protein n=1 Tax=Streptomyces sp. NPDC048669 TaxID=3155267 RepID=UPI003420A87B
MQLPGHAADWTSRDRAAVAAGIGGALRREGFLFVHNHGIPTGLIRDVYGETQRFYRLPPAEKSRYDATEQSQFLGYRGLGRERSRTHGGTEGCEQYRVGNTTDELPLPTAADLFHAPFPKSLELFSHLTHLGDAVLAACALDLGLEENAFAPYLAGGPPHRVRAVRRDRMSIQYKHRPNYGVVVRPLDALTGPTCPPAYGPLNTGPDYVAVLRSILGS